MIQLYVFPKDMRPAQSRYFISYHMTGKDLKLALGSAAAMMAVAGIVHESLHAVLVGLVVSICVTIIMQIFYMQTIHIPKDMAQDMRRASMMGNYFTVTSTFTSMSRKGEVSVYNIGLLPAPPEGEKEKP